MSEYLLSGNLRKNCPMRDNSGHCECTNRWCFNVDISTCIALQRAYDKGATNMFYKLMRKNNKEYK